MTLPSNKFRYWGLIEGQLLSKEILQYSRATVIWGQCLNSSKYSVYCISQGSIPVKTGQQQISTIYMVDVVAYIGGFFFRCAIVFCFCFLVINAV